MPFLNVATIYYNRLATLFNAHRPGRSLNRPAALQRRSLCARCRAAAGSKSHCSDAVVAPIIYDVEPHSQRPSKEDSSRSFVNYRDMSVQQLGSIYERLLEREPVRGEDGAIAMRPNPYARKDSGSFYTPQELVDLIVEKTLQPLGGRAY